ncbi:MAG: hypothetical protein ACRC10_01125 [Thermoguttaceae bacterium]
MQVPNRGLNRETGQIGHFVVPPLTVYTLFSVHTLPDTPSQSVRAERE